MNYECFDSLPCESKIDCNQECKRLNPSIFRAEVIRQFGKKDAAMILLAPHKYCHHFDDKTLTAYNNSI